MKRMIIAALFVSLLAFGCLGPGETVPEENETEEEPAPVVPDPTFTIIGPTGGQMISATGEFADVVVSLSAQNLVVRAPGGVAKKGEGHFHLILDNGDPIVAGSKTYTLTGVEDGTHTLKVELMNNDHTPYYPSISREVTFTVDTTPAEYVPKEYVVRIHDFSYDPEELTVNVGDSVTWVNEGAYPRTATCFIDGKEVFDTDVLGPGKQATIVMAEEMVCEYYDLSFVAMKGMITVEPQPE